MLPPYMICKGYCARKVMPASCGRQSQGCDMPSQTPPTSNESGTDPTFAELARMCGSDSSDAVCSVCSVLPLSLRTFSCEDCISNASRRRTIPGHVLDL